ncbi:MAG: hypothetical protein LDL30_05695, partial [Desulfovibrio sp.]|nr:hypothetical protein [Desulfovibrio sp.]
MRLFIVAFPDFFYQYIRKSQEIISHSPLHSCCATFGNRIAFRPFTESAGGCRLNRVGAGGVGPTEQPQSRMPFGLVFMNTALLVALAGGIGF